MNLCVQVHENGQGGKKIIFTLYTRQHNQTKLMCLREVKSGFHCFAHVVSVLPVMCA